MSKSKKVTVTQRRRALAKFLECKISEIEESTHTANEFEGEGSTYLVLTDSEADALARDYILDSVWAFNADFLAGHCELDTDIIESIQANGKCESNNTVLTRLIRDIDHFVSDAILSDGRGHFIGHYDHEENESGEFLIYRIS